MALAEADLATTNLAHQQQGDRYAADARLLVKFYMGTQHNPVESAEQGRPIYDELPYIQILVPGDRDNMVDRPVREQDKQRFPQYWAAFQTGDENQMQSGTPLSAWPILSSSQIRELEYFNVKTVEQLAGMSDTNAQQFAGITSLRKQAADYLELAKDGSVLTKMNAELEQRDNTIAIQENTIQEMMERLEALEKAPKKGGKKED